MTEAGVFTFSTGNLGDEMQSLAVLGHLDRVHAWLNRDRLAEEITEQETACVFNCWFLIGDDYRRPMERIKPIWHGFAGWKESLLGEWMTYLKEQAFLNGPIGCRDWYTAELLNEAGARAEWTGCLTLFLGQVFPQTVPERHGVLFVDVPRESEEYIPPEIVQKAVRLSTFPPPEILHHPLERWAMVARIARALARAELVVTRRLHVALPAASYGTPVVAVPDATISHARRRFAGFDDFVPTVFLDEAEIGLKKLDWRNIAPPRIPAALIRRHAYFREELRVRRLGGVFALPPSPLDAVGVPTQRIVNVDHGHRPGSLRLRLRHRVFPLTSRLWTDRFIDLNLPGFPGLSKLEFVVEACAAGTETWGAWGLLRDLVQDTEMAAAI